MPEYKVSDYVVRYLAARGVSHAFELCGGMLAHLLDSFYRLEPDTLVSMHHEQGAGFAAEGWARITGTPGVALATSGPGATNLLTAIGSCFFDSSPAVFITGQVNRNELKGNRPVRQLGFQETDIVSLARPITKDAFQVTDPAEIGNALDRAFQTALSGRRGPVLLDLPLDVGAQVVSLPAPGPAPERTPDPDRADAAGIDALLAALEGAERPLALVGGGVRAGRAADACRRAVERLGVPVVQSLMGLDVLGHDHPQRVGMIGSYGNRWANHALGECDLLLVLGSRLDIRQTGTDTEGFARRTILQVDLDAGEINNRVRVTRGIVGDCGDFCAALLDAPRPARDWRGWANHIAEMRARWPDTAELPGLQGLNPNVFLAALGRASRPASAFAVDVGQHQMWAGQSLVFETGQRFLTSGGMGSMGFALPAAIGASIAAPGRPVVVIAGDGAFQINIQELQTVRRRRLPIKMVVLNNRSLGMVRQFQESYFDCRYPSTVIGYDAPDFAKVAEAYGIPARTLDGEKSGSGPELDRAVAAALEWLWRDPAEPALLQVGIPLAANVYPKLAFGRPITEMEPGAKPIGMEGT